MVLSFLQTERLFLRSWIPEDIHALPPLANNPKIWRNVRDLFPYPYTLQDAQRWVSHFADNPSHHNFAITRLGVTQEGELLGGIGLHQLSDVYRRVAEIGYWLAEPFWGQGYATEAVKKLTDWGFAKLDIVRIQAGVFEGNQASMRVLEKCGYQQEARLKKVLTKDGKTFDEFLYAAFRSPI